MWRIYGQAYCVLLYTVLLLKRTDCTELTGDWSSEFSELRYAAPEQAAEHADVLCSSSDKQDNDWSEIFRFQIKLLVNAEVFQNNSQTIYSFI